MAQELGKLVDDLGSSLPKRRHEARAALEQAGEAAVEALCPALSSGSRSARQGAADALVGIGAPAVGPLIRLLEGTDAWTSMCAARALGRIGDDRAVGPLIDALDTGRPNVCTAAAEALAHLGRAAAAALDPLRAAQQRPLCQGDDYEALAARNCCLWAIRVIEKDITRSLRDVPGEMMAADAPDGKGTEPEASAAPEGSGTEPLMR